MKVEVVTGALPCVLGEGPHWDATEGVLYYVDIPQGRVLRYDPQNNNTSYVNVYGNDTVSFVVPIQGKEGKEFMIGRSRDLCRLHWDQARQERETEDGAKLGHWVVVLAKVDRGQTYNRFNDGKVDPQGRLWAGTMGHEPNPGDVKREQGSFYFCRQHPEDDKKAIVEAKFDKIDISNGLEWSLDGKTLYYIDTLTFKVEAFDYQATGGVISNRRTVFDLKAEGIKGYPDGMTIDTRGHLWVACFFGSKVLEIDPLNSQLLSQISFEGLADNITSVAFGGPDLRDLYVTSAMQTLEDGTKQGGQLFVAKDTGAQGFPGRAFQPKATL